MVIAGLALTAGSASAAVITVGDGLTATASSYQNASNYSATRAVNGSGLTGDEHSTGNQINWWSNNITADATHVLANQWIQFDLGDSYVLSTVQVWNNNQTSAGGLQNSGINQLDIYFSSALTDPGDPEGAGAGNWTLWKEDAIFTIATGANDYTGFDMATDTGVNTALPTTAVRWVRFEVDSVFSDNATYPGSVGLAEIQFTAVPEPSTTALLGLAGLSLILRRRRK